MNSEELHEWIDQYLSGHLGEDELKAFEARLVAEPDFAAEVRLQREIAEALLEKDVIDLSQKIRFVQQKKTTTKHSSKVFRLGVLLRIAAAIFFLVVAYFVIQQFTPSYSPQELATLYYNPEPEIIHIANERSLTEDSITLNNKTNLIDSLWRQVNLAYAKKSYEDALKNLVKVQEMDPEFTIQSASEFYYYRGQLNYLTNDYQSAIDDFSKVDGAFFTEKAGWYKVLSHLNISELNEAQSILETIINEPENPYKPSAQKLSKALEKVD